MNTSYAAAIDLLMSEHVDYKKIVVELAKRYPEVLIEVSYGSIAKVEQWHRDAISGCLANNRVVAIKGVRTATGYGLKEAKDIIDAVMATLRERGKVEYQPSTYYSATATKETLPSDLRKVYDQLAFAAGVL